MVEITEIAARKIKEIMAKQKRENSYLRLFIAGYG